MKDYENETATILKSLLDDYNSVEFIPVLCEMFSRALVISAEKNFRTVNNSKCGKEAQDNCYWRRHATKAQKKSD